MENKDQILVIGGGVAGMEAARQLKSLGFKPILVEKGPALGGHVASWNRLFPDMTPVRKVLDPLTSSLEGVEVLLDTTVESVSRSQREYTVVLTGGRVIKCPAVIIATGFKLFEARKKEEYGYGIYDRVITNKDLENWFNTGEDGRVPDRPSAVGFVHCVGSRDIKAGNQQCSKVCCITAIKQAIEVKERFPQAEVYCFYMDLRLFGKKYEDFYINAQRDCGIHFIRGRVSEVAELIDGRVQVKAEDTLSGRPVKVKLDLLVLMSGIVCNPANNHLASELSVPLDEDGFLRSRDNIFSVTESDRPGVFFAGTCTGPKTIPETLSEARGAALGVYNYLKGRK
jgi:heterodisulfide reductase subunit A